MNSHCTRRFACATLFGLWILFAPAAAFADGEVKRTILKRVDLTGVAGLEVITTLIEAEPGAMIPRHSHHGDEFLYVLDGGMIQVPGKDPVAMEAGQTVHFPRGTVHGGFTVVGDAAIKGVTVHVVDKGKPLVVPAE
jgi:quercetin dioxygenase-like cupin family protein